MIENVLFIPPPKEITPINKLTKYSLDALDRGVKSWKTGKYQHLFVSGGLVCPKKIQHTPAGLLYKKYLTKAGVPEKRIIVDDSARDDYESFRHALDLIREEEIILTVVANQIIFLQYLIICKFMNKTKKIKMFCEHINYYKVSDLFWLCNSLIDPKGQNYFSTEYRWKRTHL